MFGFLDRLPGLPGLDDARALARRVDTARHHGVPAGCLLELNLQHIPQETATFDPVALITSGGRRPALLHDVVGAIQRAAEDPRVAGLIARVQFHSGPPGPVQELRAAIAEFSAAKPSLAWAETYPGTLSYYLASAFGEVWMQPSGTVGLIGFATNALFLRGALDKLGVEAQFIARGEYKSAANLFTEERYTDAHREADTALVQGLRTQVWDGVASARGLKPKTLDGLAKRAPLLRDDALAAGLIDRVGFRDEAYRRMADLIGGDASPADPAGSGHPDSGSGHSGDADEADAPPRLYLSRYGHATAERPPTVPRPALPGRAPQCKIAVVTVAGPIVSGHGGPQISPLGNRAAGGDTIAAALREAAADDAVAAIVLRVDSPGGSVTGSETIWRAVAKARETGKPVIASMGAVAASGGYYIAAGADTIVANPGTITGSIGVITGKLISRELTERLGIGTDTVRTDANADAWSTNAPFTKAQRAHVEAEADLFYDDFVDRVAEGRAMSRDAVEAVARGRVWTGADAQGHGLVDELGGLREAITAAKTAAGLAADADVRVLNYPAVSLWDFLRPRSSSEPAAAGLLGLPASLPEALAGLLGDSVAAAVEQTRRSLTGAQALWPGSIHAEW